MNVNAISQMELEEARVYAENWHENAAFEKARADKLSLQVCALHARCSELLALLKIKTLTPTGEMVVRETEALLRMTR